MSSTMYFGFDICYDLTILMGHLHFTVSLDCYLSYMFGLLWIIVLSLDVKFDLVSVGLIVCLCLNVL